MTIAEELQKAIDGFLTELTEPQETPFGPMSKLDIGASVLPVGRAKVITSGIRGKPTLRSMRIARRQIDLERARRYLLAQRPLQEKLAEALKKPSVLLALGIGSVASVVGVVQFLAHSMFITEETDQSLSLSQKAAIDAGNETLAREIMGARQALRDVAAKNPGFQIPLVGEAYNEFFDATGFNIKAGEAALAQGPKKFGFTPEEEFEKGRQRALGFERGQQEDELEGARETVARTTRRLGEPVNIAERRKLTPEERRALVFTEEFAHQGELARQSRKLVEERKPQAKEEPVAAPQAFPTAEQAKAISQGIMVPGLPGQPFVQPGSEEIIEQLRKKKKVI